MDTQVFSAETLGVAESPKIRPEARRLDRASTWRSIEMDRDGVNMIGAHATPAGISMTGEIAFSNDEIRSLAIEIIKWQTAAAGVPPQVWRIDPERWARIADDLGVVEFQVLGVPVVPESGDMIAWGYGPPQVYHLTPQMAKLLGLVQESQNDRLMSELRDVARGR